MDKQSLEQAHQIFAKKLSTNKFKILNIVFEKTILKNKIAEKITLIDFEKLAKVSRDTVKKYIDELVEDRIISRKDNEYIHSYRINTAAYKKILTQ
jgi:Fic family protein